MRSCDALIANLTPFRGVSMDSGTAFEVGFMQALGRPLAGYTNVTPDYAERARAFRARGPATMDGDRADLEIEDFGLAENLMIEVAIVVQRLPRGAPRRGRGGGADRSGGLRGMPCRHRPRAGKEIGAGAMGSDPPAPSVTEERSPE